MSRAAQNEAAKIAALQQALAAEQAASYGYGVVGAHLAGARYLQAAADCVAHDRARDRLTRLLIALGATPRAAAVAYKLPVTVSTKADAVLLAITLEGEVMAAYLDLVPAADPALRIVAATGMQDAAIRAAGWGGYPQAFPGFAAAH
ncbi:MAG TPA: ferritin-like domain-containing protein [Streptosporangiaceae bacterium]|nr:ferritin-like domain-containing protein [Streptosporangiaceae bacterium]